MPIYEFQCQQCGYEFEELVRSSGDTQSLVCPQCQHHGVQKKISKFASPIISGGKVSSWGSTAKACNTGST